MKPRILIVDDNREIRDMLAGALTAQGWDVETAENGLEGLSKALEYDFEVISSDMDMPEMTGLSMTKSLLLKKPQSKVYMFSGSPEVKEVFVMAGGKQFFEKLDAMIYIKFLKGYLGELVEEMCGCEDCEEEDCWRSCDDEECRGCRESRQDREDIEFEIDRAQGRR